MGLRKETWQREIKEQLFEANPWLQRMKNVDSDVDGLLIHIPQSGGPSGVQVDRSVFPATATQREDTELVYQVKEFTSNPRHLLARDINELSYNKRQSIISEDTENLKEEVARWVMYEISRNLPASSLIATTGESAAATVAGAQGNRKIITEDDFRAARLMLNLQKVPAKNRVAVLDSNHLDQLYSDKDLKYAFKSPVGMKEGSLGRLWGFDIMEQVDSLTYDGTQVLKAPTASVGVDDTAASLFYHEKMVERGLGDIKIFSLEDHPQWYGGLMSWLLRMGARANRQDGKGVVTVYGAAGA